MNIKATDEKGNTFNKEVSLIERENGLVVSLGSPCQWYIDDIKEPPVNGDDKMWIDAGGRNHKGYSVFVSYKELMAKIQELKTSSK